MTPDIKRPVKLRRAGAWRTYIGGSLIEKLHGDPSAPDTNFPEEWILSTVRARNAGREDIVEGLSLIESGDMTLEELIARDPESALGKKHFEKFGKTPGVLVKLLDSAERLAVQVHPTRECATELFGSPFGKTEAWHIIDTREINGEKACIYFGFREGVTRESWKKAFDEQNIPEMLSQLHKFEVKPGDTFLIEGGIPHAIGAGCFLIEVQEPTDYTIRTERVTPSGRHVSDEACHQGLGFEKMFDVFDYHGYSKEETLKRWHIEKKGDDVISYDNTEMFRLCLYENDGESTLCGDGVFSGIYVLEGNGVIDGIKVGPGAQFFVSAVCDEFSVCGKMKFMRFYGPKEGNL